MIKTIDDIIKIDTKWLIHFLKENHIFKQYYKKLYNISDKENNSFSLKDVMNKNLYYTDEYIGFFKKNNDMLFVNNNLLSSNILFSSWSFAPYVLAKQDENVNEISHNESARWLNITNEYVNFKNKMKKINKDLIK